MNLEEDIFSSYVILLQKGITIIEDRIHKVEEQGRANSLSLPLFDAEKDAAIHIYKARSLKLYKDTLSFIAQEILINEPQRHYFVLAHVRTLLDIYAHFIHLQEEPDDSRRALVCIANQLLTYAGLFDNQVYSRTLLMYKNFLKKENFSFPPNLEQMNFIWLRDNKLKFMTKNKLLIPENIKKYSNTTLNIFTPQNTHNIYSHLSEFMHGNPYYYNESKHNERFWAITMCLMTTAFLIELVDIYTLNRRYPKDFRIWLSEVNKHRLNLLNLWKSRMTT